MTLTKESLRSALAPRLIEPQFLPLYVAARFVERLLPEKCDHGNQSTMSNWCDDCNNTGQLWDEGLVEVVAKALDPGRDYTREAVLGEARAVLAALTQEVGK